MSKVISIQGNHDFTDNYKVTSDMNVGGALHVESTQVFTGTTGALIVDGGASVASLHIGSGTSSFSFPTEQGENNQILQVNSNGNLTFSHISTLSNSLTITDTTPATSGTSGALIVSGGASFAENIYIGGKVSFNVRTETTGTTLGNDHILNMNNSGTVTVNVPDATLSENEGVRYVIIKQTANQVNITSVVASQLFSGGSTFTTISLTGGAGERMVLLCNSVYWFVM